ncbi:DedA family protein [Actinophytocola sp.]|uniref:DedA family protein n=1 Tax=Actinophytocola sp. TaxID=1872138 RepID=UPI002EDADF08
MFEVLNRVTGELTGMLDTPWVWLVVLLVAGLDAVLPFMPSETTVIIVAVLVTPSPTLLLLLVVVAAVGAMAGDWLGYVVGQRAGPGVVAMLDRGERGRRLHRWAEEQLRRRGDLLILAGRYLPGGRVAAMLSAGALGYRARRFLVVDAVATTVWATYATAIGFVGGVAFAEHPVVGLMLAFAIGLVLAALIEVGRRVGEGRCQE